MPFLKNSVERKEKVETKMKAVNESVILVIK